MKSIWRNLIRITIAFLIIHALMSGVLQTAFTAFGQEGKSGIIQEQWDKLKYQLFGLLP